MLDFAARHRIITGIVTILFVLVFGAYATLWITSHGPHREYEIDYTLPAQGEWEEVGDLEVGIAVRDVTPLMDLYDPWVDVNSNSKFDAEPDENGIKDTYTDRNGNGTFDFVWIAGFGMNRPAQGVNDPLWARAIAFRNNGLTVALVSIDSVGITYDRYISMRKKITEDNPDIDHVVFAATHTHNAPDTMGIWSYWVLWGSRFDENYMNFLQSQTVDAVLAAVEDLEPADAVLAEAHVPQENFTRDSRKPIVVDHKLPVAWFKRKGTEESIGTFASWGMHPEAFGGKNPLITSDFCHYFREAMEDGLEGPQGFPGFGGKCVYFSGPVGGLMTQLSLDITDRFGDVHDRDSAGKAQAQGENLAILAAEALRGESAVPMEDQRVAVSAKTYYLPLGWPFKAAVILGIVHPGIYGGVFTGESKTEVSALRLGGIEILTTPGEVFPEIIDGGIETPEGADFAVPPVEVPPLRNVMSGDINMNFNLAMDEIGYIVPKSQWDQEEPYTYGRDSAPYGEIYTGEPEIAPMLHRASLEMLDRLHTTLGEDSEATAALTGTK